MAIMAHIWKRTTSDAEESSTRKVMTLDQAPVGCPLRLVAGKHGRKLALRLAEMGLTPGTEFSIIQKSGGPILISVRGARMALGRGVAANCAVIPLNGCPGHDS
jgi:Fe2+ transport system protein FeoA